MNSVSVDQRVTILALVWLIWMVLLCRRLGVSWMPVVPVLFGLGLVVSLMLNRIVPYGGSVLLGIALLLPFVGTIQLVLRSILKRRGTP